ncbi:hypothetical protein H6F98_16235 [Microcoleus sp. FACHB-SPT15]|uniref:hypothetical protein n=1 Tax=Microcoleus sp. FACHB-SPT15 TaxID=2692830 RepID=UPI001784AC2A|nr:hypothetical protein [Microcoleus sp. FACHB-SPT15]MBD1806988.1 hypothetical protein [Microcoleus sp. FACHB-SPT15]
MYNSIHSSTAFLAIAKRVKGSADRIQINLAPKQVMAEILDLYNFGCSEFRSV